MTHTIFFSWQADRPTKAGRNLIERALEVAISRISQDAAVEEAVRELTVDRDTKGVPGSPPIFDTILRKIDQAAVFVPDLTFVAQRHNGRPSPNPNVLLEYGWALKALGHSRIIPVMNVAYGKPTSENMPFDLAHLRYPITYDCPENASDDARKAARIALAKELDAALRTYFESNEFKQSLPKPPTPAPFIPREPKDGQSRFRGRGASIGVSDDAFTLRHATEVILHEGDAVWLRVMPSVDPGRRWLLTDLEAAASPQRGGQLIMPLAQRAGSYDFVRAEDGFGNYGIEKDPGVTRSVVFAFVTGEVWAIDSRILSIDPNRRTIPNTIALFTNGLTAYADFLARIGVQPPYKWIAGMENVKGRSLTIEPPPGQTLVNPIQGSCVTDVVFDEGLHHISDSPRKSLRPFFTKLYDSCRLKLPDYFDR